MPHGKNQLGDMLLKLKDCVHATEINVDKQQHAARCLYPENWIYHGAVLKKKVLPGQKIIFNSKH